MDIGNKIRLLRISKNMTQVDLAKIIGVSKTTMSNFERNNTIPDPSIIIKIATYFNISIDSLYDYQYHIDSQKNKPYTKDELNVLKYYSRLNDEDKDYIKGLMIQLYSKKS